MAHRFPALIAAPAPAPGRLWLTGVRQIRAGADFVKVMTIGARSNELEDPEPLQLTEPELVAGQARLSQALR